jgi:hypothetical protein
VPTSLKETGSRSSRRVWVRQAGEWMWVEHDGTVRARVYPDTDRWKILVPSVQIIAGPPELMQGFIAVEIAKAEAISLYLAALPDRKTATRIRRATRLLDQSAAIPALPTVKAD